MKEEYIACLMMYGEYSSRFGTINTNLENKMVCGLDSNPKSNAETVRLINNYHVSKKLMQATQVKEEAAFAHTRNDTKTSNTNKMGESKCFNCGDPNNWAYYCTQLSEKERY